MLFDGEGISGLQDDGTAAVAAAAVLIFLPTNVANNAKDDCIEAAAETEAADGCFDGCFAKKVSLEPDRVERRGVTLLFEQLNKVIVDYRLTIFLLTYLLLLFTIVVDYLSLH